jgi:TRAP-type C4-dicarboxylate transport system permease small subunit
MTETRPRDGPPGPAQVLNRIVDGYFRALQVALAALLALLVVPVTLQIVARYTDLIPRYIWTEEAARFLFIWIILIGATIAVRERTHFGVDVLPRPVSARGRAAAALVVDAAVLVVALVFVAYGYEYARFGYSQTSELTGLNMLTMHVAFPLAGANWILFVLPRVIAAAGVLVGRRDDAG